MLPGKVELFTVGDKSKKLSKKFPINISNTIIFKNKIEILWRNFVISQFVTIIPDEETFKVAERLNFSLDDFSVSIYVHLLTKTSF